VVREAALKKAVGLKKIPLGPTAISDLELITVGAFSPLTGFMTQADYRSVLEDMRLSNGLVWTIPITLAVSRQQADELREGEAVALVERGNHILGILQVAEKFTYDKEREAAQVYRTTEDTHPGVARLYAQGEVLLGGDIYLLDRPQDRSFPEFRHDPAQTRRMFAQRGWWHVVAFQTRNPPHRAHEYIQKTALEIVDGLLLHPLVGETKKDDIPADVRMKSYQSLLRDYYPPDRIILGVFPAAMRYAGPREAIFHAIVHKNYGCTHFIVGRDHAGVGNYYGIYDTQLIFDEFAPQNLGITPLFFEHTFWCRKCGGMVSAKTCPHDASYHVVLSGTQVREMLSKGEAPPPEFTRPEVAAVLIEGVAGERKERKRTTAGAEASGARWQLLREQSVPMQEDEERALHEGLISPIREGEIDENASVAENLSKIKRAIPRGDTRPFAISQADFMPSQPTATAPSEALPGVEEQPQPSEALPCSLVVLSTGHRISLPAEGELILGRTDLGLGFTPDVDLTSDIQGGQSISRRHAKITAFRGRHLIEDLGSIGGTAINGRSLNQGQRVPLQDGDHITLGPCALTYRQSPRWPGIYRGRSYHAFLAVTFSGNRYYLPPKPEIILGRSDPEKSVTVDIDLSQEGKLVGRTSTRHARMIEESGLHFVEDLGSTHGTKLNSSFLEIGELVPLHPGDHLCLGSCILYYDFETQVKQKEVEA
jgi:sulfate adenylyltransferase